MHDDLDDFIEKDVFSDEDERQQEDEEIARPARKGLSGFAVTEATGLDEAALEDMRMAFGDGNDYLFALEMEDEEEEQQEDEEKQLDLKDVFEPSQLAEKMMTDEDNIIRSTDEPERYQIARKPYQHVILTEEQFREEAVWISNLMLLKKRLNSDLHEPFQRAVAKVLEFMVTDDWEVPFIFQHRKDYLIHAVKIPIPDGGTNPDGGKYIVEAEKLLSMIDLWDIFEYDLKFRALIDKRNTLQTTYDNLQTISNVKDKMFEEMLPAAVTMEELQDVQDYLYFQYSTELKDIALFNSSNNEGENGITSQRRKASTKSFFERVRNSRAYGLVRAFGITPDAFAQNAMKTGRRQYIDDATEKPGDMADNLLDSNFTNASHAMKAARTMFAEELTVSPRVRKVMRQAFYMSGVIECYRTEKGLKKMDEL